MPKVGRIKTDSYNRYSGRDPPKLVSETPIHNLLTVKETAEYLRIPIPTVYYLVQRAMIPAIRIGGRWRIKKSSLDRNLLHQDKPGQPTVLVVDDDPGLQNLFRTFLRKIGFSRVVVGTAKEADVLHQDRQGQPTVLVVDDDPSLQDLLSDISKAQPPKGPSIVDLNI